ncbi:MAG: hypothetical protein MJY47_02085 [Fibrobacter sp.]|nr:hypothetical protein [Fibrobacter sp.]
MDEFSVKEFFKAFGLGSFIWFVVFFFFFLLPALSWGACSAVVNDGRWDCSGHTSGTSCNGVTCSVTGGFTQSSGSRYCYYEPSNIRCNSAYGTQSWWVYDRTKTCCDTQAEADSVKCANNPSAEGCTDACTEYRTSCEANGGYFSGSVNYAGVCVGGCDLCSTEPYKEALRLNAQGCCEAGFKPAAHCTSPPVVTGSVSYSGLVNLTGCEVDFWQQKKVCEEFLDSLNETSSSSSVPVSSSSSVSEYCQIFPDDLACICADDSTRPECAYLRSSSSEGTPEGSSGSEGGEGSSGSGGGEGGEGSSGSGGGGAGGVGDWEYDYRDSLHKIINSTTRTAKNTQGITDSLGTIATLLRFARCLWDDCTNYDSLRAIMGSDSGEVAGIDLDTSGYLGGMEALRDSLAEYWGWGDSATLGDVGYGIDSGSVDSAYGAIREQIGSVFGVGGNNPAQSLGDSLKDILEDKFPTSSWGYTQSCPEVLRTPVTFNIGEIVVNSGYGLGHLFCSPIPNLGLTLGTIARAVIRLIITITMAFGIYKFAMTGGKGE